MFDRSSLVVPWGLLSAVIVGTSAHAARAEVRTIQTTGAVVEEVAKGSAAEKAGFQPGDVILSWRREVNPPANPKPASGEIGSPFDLAWVEVEQAPRGRVILNGKRGPLMLQWSMPSGAWKVGVLPRLPAATRAALDEAKALLAAGKPDEALGRWQEVAHPTGRLAAAWLSLSFAKALAGKQAVTQADSAFAAALRQAPSSASFVSYWLNREWGEVLRLRSEWEPALERHRLALESLRPDNAESLAGAGAHAALGSVEWTRGRLDSAEDYFRSALAIREKLAPGSLEVAASLNNLGLVLWNRGDLATAEEYTRRSLATREKLVPESLDVAASLNNLGNLAWNRGDLPSAEGYYRRSLTVREKLVPESLEVAASLNNLGAVAWSRGDLPAAADNFRRSLAIKETLSPGSLDVAATLNNLGEVARNRGDLVEAERYYHSSLLIREKLAPGSLDVAATLNNLGSAALERGNLAAAEEHYQNSLMIRERLAPSSLEVAGSLNNLGSVAKDRGDLVTAEDHYRRSLAIAEKLAPGSLVVAQGLNNLGNVAADREALSSAEDYYRQSLAIKETLAPGSLDVAEALNNLGELARTRGDLAAAGDYLRRSLAIEKGLAPHGLMTASTLEDLGQVAQDHGELAVAREHYGDALVIREQLASGSRHEAESRHSLGKTYRLQGELHLATESLCKAVDSLEQQNGKLGGSEEVKSSFAATYANYYHDCAVALFDGGRREQAFHILERSRARSLLAMLAERDLPFAADLSPELARQSKLTDAEYDRTQAALSELNPDKNGEQLEELLGRLRELRVKQEEVAAKIKRASPHYGSLKYPEPLDLSRTRSVLDPGTVLLAYSVGKEETLLFVVKPNGAQAGFTVSRMPITERALREKVHAFRALIQRADTRDLPRLASRGAELYDMLLKPAEAAIVDSKRVLISPDGPLHTLPFVSLTRQSGKKGTAQYVAQWKPVHVVVSATVYAELQRNRRDRESTAAQLVAFGDPKYSVVDKARAEEIGNAEVRSVVRGGFRFSPLPASRKEVQEIASLYPGRAQANLGEEATEERAKAVGSDTRYIHFATHGYVNERFPLDSALALTIPERVDEGRDNGLLQAWEVFEKVRIDADLVTLSACETGLGKEVGGEGLVGLTRAFQYAGARSVLASLWSVSDESTAALMRSVYGQLKNGETKDEALRAAQTEMISSKGDRAHPFHWAGFEVIGDWK